MKHLKEYCNETLNSDTPFVYEGYYDSVFRKIDIYNKNTKLINEGRYTTLPTHIPYSITEQAAISEMLSGLQFAFLYNYACNTYESQVNEGISDIADKMKDALNKGKDAFLQFIKKLLDKIPADIKDAFEKIGELIEKGINNVKSFVVKLTKIFSILGDNLNGVLSKLGCYRDEMLEIIPDENNNLGELSDALPSEPNQKKVINFFISRINAGLQNKTVVKQFTISECKQNKNQDNVNESGAVIAAGLTFFGVGLLIAVGLYKILPKSGKFLSNKLEKYLLSEKTIQFANKLYNNVITRFIFGLKVSKSNEELTKFEKFKQMLFAIIINIVIAQAVYLVIEFCITTAFIGLIGSTGVNIIIAAIVAGKNIFSTVINRLLNFKKETTTKDGKKQVNYFFDLVTMFGILMSIGFFLWKIPAVKDWFTNLWDKTVDFYANIGSNTAEKTGATVAAASATQSTNKTANNETTKSDSSSSSSKNDAKASASSNEKTSATSNDKAPASSNEKTSATSNDTASTSSKSASTSDNHTDKSASASSSEQTHADSSSVSTNTHSNHIPSGKELRLTGYFDEKGNWVSTGKLKDVMVVHDGTAYVYNPDNHMYYKFVDVGKAEPVPISEFKKVAEAIQHPNLPDSIELFNKSMDGKTGILDDIKNWGGYYILRSDSLDISNTQKNAAEAISKVDFKSISVSIQGCTTNDGTTWVRVGLHKLSNVQNGHDVKTTSDFATEIFDLSEIFDEMDEPFKTVEGIGAQYDAFAELTDKYKDSIIAHAIELVKERRGL